MNGLRYELFIRGAFGSDVERAGDPAQLAESGLFDIASEISKVKAATVYAMVIYKNTSPTNVRERMGEVIDEVMQATDSQQIDTIIREFNSLSENG
ncbi:hypothetical protein [Sporosarcina sp. JAI121]|uniref:hypothetical protein n=1 Tax=Sporosarcina sp. JAI121 TaxID=2723064 RepID=UPI0015CED8C0|nr:hypothetical protein [Sporosarcina sp. JAI121]NYF23927.1 hypothetical protein [Sporosarcina sp. JAI121]